MTYPLNLFINTLKICKNINLEDGITDNDTCINEHINISNDVLHTYFTEAVLKKV